ncbi:unnamed protein product [Durusdinium trenchii]|uniref:Uncharacterized protein n=1 Tax=Durusdinium trenchii TaxID=1381693 RepID=A0ABP0HH79_9DINO
MKASPPSVPPPRHLLQPKIAEAAEGAAFRARCKHFARDLQLDEKDMEILERLNPEVADLIMSEPPTADLYETRQRARARLRDSTMEDFLVEIKDLEDDCDLDRETSLRLRALPRQAIQEILQQERHWTPETQRQQIQELVARFEPKGPRQSAQSTKKEEVILIEGDAEPRKSKEDSETKTAQEAPSKTRSVRTAVFSSPLMRRVEGLIEQHAHSSHFIKEVRRYSQSLNLGREVELVFLMLSATVASGIMKTCRTPDVQFLLQQVRAVNPTVADLGHELLLQRQREWYAYQWQTMAGGYPAWGWPGAPGYYPQVRPKKSKKEKKARKDKKDKKKTKGTKRKASRTQFASPHNHVPHHLRCGSEEVAAKRSSSESTSNRAARVADGDVKAAGPSPKRPTPERKEELGKGAQDADLLASFQARFDALLKDSKDGSGVPPVAEQSTDTSPSPAARSDCEASTRAVETPGRASKSGGSGVQDSLEADEMYNWLKKIDGKGALLQYMPKLKERYHDLQQLKTARLDSAEAKPGYLGGIKPELWEACGIARMGHRLLFAKAILAL